MNKLTVAGLEAGFIAALFLALDWMLTAISGPPLGVSVEFTVTFYVCVAILDSSIAALILVIRCDSLSGEFPSFAYFFFASFTIIRPSRLCPAFMYHFAHHAAIVSTAAWSRVARSFSASSAAVSISAKTAPFSSLMAVQ